MKIEKSRQREVNKIRENNGQIVVYFLKHILVSSAQLLGYSLLLVICMGLLVDWTFTTKLNSERQQCKILVTTVEETMHKASTLNSDK